MGDIHGQHRYYLLVAFCIQGILAGDWSVDIPSDPICAMVGSSVVLPCSYDYPQTAKETKGGLSAQVTGSEELPDYKVLNEMWCLEESRCITQRYVFHSAGIFPDPSYQSRVKYLGQSGTKNCSLRINDLKQTDTGTYIFYLITNHPTEKMPAQTGIQLLVTESPNDVAALAGPSSFITEGAALRLACCSPASTSQSIFRWFRSTNPSQVHDGQVWRFSKVKSDQSGSYYCQLQTGERKQNSTTVAIDVQYPPRNMTLSVWHPDSDDDLRVTLSCSSDANPPVHAYIWYQGESCSTAADKSFFQGRQTLASSTGRGPTFSNITTENRGQHCCMALNQHGSQALTITLRGSTASVALVIGVSVGILLVILATVAFLITRRQKSTRHRSYALTETISTQS
uniref:Ig-like domain-containing protein n=1 Tax=Oryzias sinensis TaxID=183150 RepID=A0A8C7WZ94_9TELE